MADEFCRMNTNKPKEGARTLKSKAVVLTRSHSHTYPLTPREGLAMSGDIFWLLELGVATGIYLIRSQECC